MDDEDQAWIDRISDEGRAELAEIEADIARLVQRHAETRVRVDPHSSARLHDPIVTGWIVGYEYTSVQLEQHSQAARGIIAPDSQMLSTSLGLGSWIADCYR